MTPTALLPSFQAVRAFARPWLLAALPLLLACQVEAPVHPEDSLKSASSALVFAPGEVVVSLTLDDNRASQEDAALLLEARGMRGTFFVNSGRIGMDGYLSYAQILRIQAAGHEVGGHTISHPPLTTLDPDSQRREVCDDRVTLLDAGLRITSFAYPFGDQDATTRQIIIDCNYNSARESGGLRTPDSCSSCPYAERIPPPDPYAFRNPGSVQRDWTLADLQGFVLRAEQAGGGWVPLTFHEICPTSCPISEAYGFPRADFIAFLDWLAARSSRGTSVATVDQVIGGSLKPPVSRPPADGGVPNPSPGGETPAGTVQAAAVLPGATVVTITFADTLKSQTVVGPLFAKYGMLATFYVNSGRIGRGSSYLSLEDLRALAAAGHEIASHTVDHVRLEKVSVAEARHQICDDRANLMALGFPVASFAYPFSSDTPTARQIVIGCNFNSARATGGLRHPYGCSSCPPAETLPPRDVFIIRTPPSIQRRWTLANLQSLVLQAEAAGGGWIQVSLHEICDGCDTYAIKESLLEEFLAWMAPRASRGTRVLPTREVIGGAVKPPVYSDGGTFPFDGGVGPEGGVRDGGLAMQRMEGVPLYEWAEHYR